jgi:hypothetical protein
MVVLFIWRALPWLIVGAVVGGLGYAVMLGWRAITDSPAGDSAAKTESVPDTAGIPAVIASTPILLWLALAVLIAGGYWVIAPGRYPEAWVRMLRAGATVIALAGLLGIWLST